jgi:hypothetical protein
MLKLLIAIKLIKATIDNFGLIWFSSFRENDLNGIFYHNMPNLHNLYKSNERKKNHKNGIHVYVKLLIAM